MIEVEKTSGVWLERKMDSPHELVGRLARMVWMVGRMAGMVWIVDADGADDSRQQTSRSLSCVRRRNRLR